ERRLEGGAGEDRAPRRGAEGPARPGRRGTRIHAARTAARGHLRAGGADRRRARPGPERAADGGRAGSAGRCAMSFSPSKVGIIARREYLTTVRRPAFVLALLLTPTIFFIAGVVSPKAQIADELSRRTEERVVAVVDSTGLFANAPLAFDFV